MNFKLKTPGIPMILSLLQEFGKHIILIIAVEFMTILVIATDISASEWHVHETIT